MSVFGTRLVSLQAYVTVSKQHNAFIFMAEFLRIETVCFSESLVSTNKYTRCYNPEEQHQHFYCSENRKSQDKIIFS